MCAILSRRLDNAYAFDLFHFLRATPPNLIGACHPRFYGSSGPVRNYPHTRYPRCLNSQSPSSSSHTTFDFTFNSHQHSRFVQRQIKLCRILAHSSTYPSNSSSQSSPSPWPPTRHPPTSSAFPPKSTQFRLPFSTKTFASALQMLWSSF